MTPLEGSNATPAYIVTVGDDRIVRLPDTIPAGTTVAVVVIPCEEAPYESSDEATRKMRFDLALKAVREAIEHGYGTNLPSDEEITRLIEEARKHPHL
jgi:hypothetical protein